MLQLSCNSGLYSSECWMGARGYLSNMAPSCGGWQIQSFPCYLLGGALHSLTCRPFHTDDWVSSQYVADFSQSEWLSESKMEATVLFYDLISEVTHFHFCLILFTLPWEWVTNSSPHSTIRLHLLKKVTKDVWTFF